MRRLLPAVVTGGLGLNFWVVVIGLPAVHVGIRGAAWAPCVLPLAALAAGAAASVRPELWPRAGRLAAALLLLAFPSLCVVPLALERTLTGVNVYGPGNLIVAALALLGYSVGTLLVVRRPAVAPVAQKTTPIQGWSLPDDARRRRRARTAVLTGAGLVCASTSYAAFLRPGAAEDLAAAYGAGAAGATVGVAAAALLMPLGVLLVYFAPPLRRPVADDPPPPPASRLRSTLALVVVGVAAAVTLVLLRAGR